MRGSRWISNFRQTCLIVTSPSVSNVEEWSFWELDGETPSLSTFSCVRADITGEEELQCPFLESLSKPTRPANVYIACSQRRDRSGMLSTYMRLTSPPRPHRIVDELSATRQILLVAHEKSPYGTKTMRPS